MNNFLTTLRKYKTSSILNILGLAAAFSALYIILVQVNYDFSYNKAIKDGERIFLLQTPDWEKEGAYMTWLSRPLAENTISGSPVVESFGTGYTGALSGSDYCMQKNGAITEMSLASNRVSLSWLDIFGYKATQGSFKELEKPKTLAISEAAAKKYGISLGDNIYPGLAVKPEGMYTIVAIFQDMPVNTDLGDIELLENYGDYCMDNWSEWSFNYFVKLRSVQDVEAFYEHAAKKQREILEQQGNTGEDLENNLKRIKVRLLPLQETYFSGSDDNVPGRQGSKATTYTLLAIAVLVVMIALINFINFFFALVPIRIRSVNTKKIFGCSLFKLRMGFITEALGIVFISLLLAWLCVDIIKTSNIANYISAPLNLGNNLFVLGITLTIAILIALAGSIYPSYYITSFPAAMVIKGSFAATKSGQRLRIMLIGLQFTISIGLIITTLLIKLQHSYMMNYDMGFNKEMLLSSYLPRKITNTLESRDAFSNKLKQNPQIRDMAYGDNNFISQGRMGWGREFKGKQISLQCMPVSWNFLEFMGIQIADGRNFTREDELKENGTFILNEKAAREFEMTTEDKLSGHAGPTEIAGFCKDFNFRPLQSGISPFSFYVFGKDPWRMPNHMYLRTTENADIPQVIEYIKNTVMEFAPDTRRDKLEVEFFDQELGRLYKTEQRLTTLISLFTALSIIISLMGVFGLVMFETQYRHREIGLRRVHGATVVEILNIFNFKFIKIIGVCFLIAAPVSYLAIDRWLGTFAYRTPIHWWVFALSLCIVLLITIALVTLRSLKAATDNPVDAIKCE